MQPRLYSLKRYERYSIDWPMIFVWLGVTVGSLAVDCLVIYLLWSRWMAVREVFGL